MTHNLNRLLKPGSIAVIGDASWCQSVIVALQSSGYVWDIWPVHPTEARISDIQTFPSVADLPHPPDVAFVGLQLQDALQVLENLAKQGAGGAILAAEKSGQAVGMIAALQEAVGDMPVLGPGFNFFINALDRISLSPDGCRLPHVPRGVAVVSQGAALAQYMAHARGLPVAYLAALGDGALIGMAELSAALLCDPRVTALGLDIPNIGDLRGFEALAATARRLGKPIVVLRTGGGDKTGDEDSVLDVLLMRLGAARVEGMNTLLETLKLLHFVGPLPANQIAALIGLHAERQTTIQAAARYGVAFAPLGDSQKLRLLEVLGPGAFVTNPLNTYSIIQTDDDALADVFTQMMQGGAVLTLLVAGDVADNLRTEALEQMLTAAARAHAHVGMPVAIVFPDLDVLPEDLIRRIIKVGVIPMMGLNATMAAIATAVSLGGPGAHPAPLLLPRGSGRASDRLHLLAGDAAIAALGLNRLDAELSDTLEIRIVIRVFADPLHVYVLQFGHEEDREDRSPRPALLLPVGPHDVHAVLARMAIGPVRVTKNDGPAVAGDVVLTAVMAVQAYVRAQAGRVVGLEVKMLMSASGGATVTDAVIETAEATE